MPNSDLDLTKIDADLDEVRANVNHGDAQHNPWALQALRSAEQLRAALGPAFAVIRQNAMTEAARRQRADQDDDLHPSPAQMGDTMTVEPGEWTPLDDHGTQLYVYGDQPVDVAIQHAEVGDEIRRLTAERDKAQQERDALARRCAVRFECEVKLLERIEKAYEALAIEEFDGDSCPDLESTIEHAIGRYRAVCKSEGEASDRVQELRIQLDAASRAFGEIDRMLDEYRGAKALREGVRAVVDRARVVTRPYPSSTSEEDAR